MPTITTNFSARDYTAIFEWLLSILEQEVPELTDKNFSDPGQALIRLFARVADSMSLYIDEAFSESFIHSAKFKQSLIDIARSLDLLPKLPNAAVATMGLTRKSQYIGNVGDTGIISLPQYTQVFKVNGIGYSLVEALTMQRTDTYKEVSVIQGERVSLTLTSANFTQDQNTGRWYYNLGTNVAADTVSFVENSVITWSEQESFWRSFSTDDHFALEVYADLYNGIADTIFFTVGNGIQGKALTQGSTYTLSYIRCDGASGNTGSGTITLMDSGYDTMLTVTNTTSATGGAGVESIEDFRLRIPLVVRTQRRAVTKEDYEALVVSIPGVKRVQGVDRNDDDYEFPWEYVILYVVPEGGGEMSTSLYNSVMSVCREKGALGSWYKRYILYNATEYPIDVTCTIGVSYGYEASAVISSVSTAINSFFSVDNFDISDVFLIGDLHTVLMAVTGVSWVELPGMVNVQPGYGNLITVGSISVTASS
jgi:hypothetical protein